MKEGKRPKRWIHTSDVRTEPTMSATLLTAVVCMYLPYRAYFYEAIVDFSHWNNTINRGDRRVDLFRQKEGPLSNQTSCLLF